MLPRSAFWGGRVELRAKMGPASHQAFALLSHLHVYSGTVPLSVGPLRPPVLAL